MWPYWLLFLVPAFQAVSKLSRVGTPIAGKRWPAIWHIVFVFLALMIGLRHEVGGDWGNYVENIANTANLTFAETLVGLSGDPADKMLNWIAEHSGLGMYLVNSIYAILFTWGLLVFCRNQPRPWLALTVAVPYLITVVAMGYTRQGVAIGLGMLGLVALDNKSILKFLLFIALAATVHTSAIVLLPLAVLSGTRHRLLLLFWLGVTVVLLFALLLQEYVNSLVQNYIDSKYDSSGAAIRIAMNAFPAALFLLMRKRFMLLPAQREFWTWMAWGALAFVGLLFISPSSTAVDRVALYWIPLQLFIWSRLPDAMGRPGGTNAGWVYAVVGYSATVHFVWLFFADNAGGWLPYQFYPWVWLWR
jgi:hypothetical protein